MAITMVTEEPQSQQQVDMVGTSCNPALVILWCPSFLSKVFKMETVLSYDGQHNQSQSKHIL